MTLLEIAERLDDGRFTRLNTEQIGWPAYRQLMPWMELVRLSVYRDAEHRMFFALLVAAAEGELK